MQATVALLTLLTAAVAAQNPCGPPVPVVTADAILNSCGKVNGPYPSSTNLTYGVTINIDGSGEEFDYRSCEARFRICVGEWRRLLANGVRAREE